MFANEYGWTLDYIYGLSPIEEVHELIDAIVWRKQNARYEAAYNSAMIAVATYNTSGSKKRTKITDLIGKPPKKEKPKVAGAKKQKPVIPSDIREDAAKKGVKLPDE